MSHNELFTDGAADDGPSRPPDEKTSSRSGTNPYADLKRIVEKNGLLDRQPAYFGGKVVLTLCLLAVGLALLPILGGSWLQLANAVYWPSCSSRSAFLPTTSGTGSSLSMPLEEHWLTLIWQPAARNQRQWWIDKHNQHHAHPNHMDVDPDVDIPLLAFEEEQAFEKRGLARFVVKYQAVLIFPLRCCNRSACSAAASSSWRARKRDDR